MATTCQYLIHGGKMIAIKNLQNLNEILLQEQLLQGIALHYTDMVSDKKAGKLLEEIIKTSKKNHTDILAYMETNIGQPPIPVNGGIYESVK